MMAMRAFSIRTLSTSAALSIAGGILLAFGWDSFLAEPSSTSPIEYRILIGASVTFFVGVGAAVLSVWNAIQTSRNQRNQKLNESLAEAYVTIWKACSLGYRVISDATTKIPNKSTIEEARSRFKEADTITLLISDKTTQGFYEFWGEFDEAIENLQEEDAERRTKSLQIQARKAGEALGRFKEDIKEEIGKL